MMLIYLRRQRWLFFVLIFASFLLIYKYNSIRKSFLTDEHRIYTSLLVELPQLERLIRVKQANLSSIQNRLTKIEKHLFKYTWHLQRLVKTIDYNKQQQKKISRFNSFDLDFERNFRNNQTKFLIYFHWINISNGVDYDILNKFHFNISIINSPYVTLNKGEAYLHVIYLPIRSYQRNICYRDLIDKKYFVLYEFLNYTDEDIDERCFQGNFFPIKFYNQFITNQTYVNNDRWRLNEQPKTHIGIIYLNCNSTNVTYEYERLKNEYETTLECFHRSCYERIFQKNISITSIICSSSYSIAIQYEFYEIFFKLLAHQIHVIVFNCENYLPYSKVIDWSHPSSSLSWLFTIYFQTFERRFHTLVAYLRTNHRLPTLSNDLNFIEERDRLIKEKDFYYLIHQRNFNFTRMPIGLMDHINFQSDTKPLVYIEPTFYDQWNLLFNQIDPIENSKNENLSLKDFLGDFYSYLPSVHVEIVYIFNLSNNLNNRFLPWNQFVRTDCILSLDDDSFLRQDEVEYGFRVWKENPSRLVGFISRSHKSNTSEYDASSSSCSYSMILTGAAFLHRWYLDFYTNIMSEQIRQYVQLNMNCEDIAMNFLISYLTKQSPIKIGHRETFYCYNCQESLSSILEKEQEQSVVYGSTDFGKNCTTNDKYKDLLEKVSAMLKIKPHSVKTEKENSIKLLTAVECKGINWGCRRSEEVPFIVFFHQKRHK
ncbi:unnamed protein product [Rotaria socialis]|uniref:Glycosyl transferase 64 domain-containing protein n=1 Tax=Rotaria socialis TaxID=392032 RepID=A0A818ZEV4_9BILA|nr:unnamed protein product [Rotaria socialis]CAF4631708.1 unnamed protein product [Rotaria socialis]